MILEVCVDRLESALIAEKIGANRIELCDSLAIGGTTPSFGMMELILEKVDIDVYVLIRPRGGDFCYSDYEIEIMRRDILKAKDLGAAGVVIGVLDGKGNVDLAKMKILVEAAGGMDITFHRAFDMCRDPFESLDYIKELGIKRVLTSGQDKNAIEGMSLIERLTAYSQGDIEIMPGGGIRLDNIEKIIHVNGVKSVHLSGRKRIESKMEYRNENVSMGGNTVPSEYEDFIADEDVLQKIVHNLLDEE